MRFLGETSSEASPVAISTINFASWFGSRGRLAKNRVCHNRAESDVGAESKLRHYAAFPFCHSSSDSSIALTQPASDGSAGGSSGGSWFCNLVRIGARQLESEVWKKVPQVGMNTGFL